MSEQRVVNSTLHIFGCSRVPNLEYLLDVVTLKSTKSFLTPIMKQMKTSHKNFSFGVDDTVASDRHMNCEVTIIQDLYLMALAINLLANRGVEPDVMLLVTIDQSYVLNFNRFMQHMVATKANIDGAETTNIPNSTQQNTKEFNNWCNTIEEELYQKTSVDGILFFDMLSVHPKNMSIMDMCTKTRPC